MYHKTSQEYKAKRVIIGFYVPVGDYISSHKDLNDAHNLTGKKVNLFRLSKESE